jgi:hypothetical protein
MKLKRYELHQTNAGSHMRLDETDGEWVDADEAEVIIRELKSVLRVVADTLPFIGGNENRVQRLLNEIKAVM